MVRVWLSKASFPRRPCLDKRKKTHGEITRMKNLRYGSGDFSHSFAPKAPALVPCLRLHLWHLRRSEQTKIISFPKMFSHWNARVSQSAIDPLLACDVSYPPPSFRRPESTSTRNHSCRVFVSPNTAFTDGCV